MGQILAKLNHKNIVSYYGSFVEDYNVNVVMEYADGGTLHSRMASAKAPFPEEELLNVFTQVSHTYHYSSLRGFYLTAIPGAITAHPVPTRCRGR